MKKTALLIATVLSTATFAQTATDSVNTNHNANDTLLIEVQEFTTGTIATLGGADEDVTDTITVSLSTSDFSVTPATNAIDATSDGIGDVVSNVTLDYATQSEYVFETTLTDKGGLSMTATTKVRVTPLAITDITPDVITVAENSPISTHLLEATITLPNGNAQNVSGVTYTLVSVDGVANPDWSINADDELVVPANLNYEEDTQYEVEVTAERGNLTFTDTILVNVTNVNEAPFKVFVK